MSIISMEHLHDVIISKGSRKVNVLSRVMAYMSLSKTKKLVNLLLAHNLVTSPLFGCSMVILMAYMTGACVYYTSTNRHFLKNY